MRIRSVVAAVGLVPDEMDGGAVEPHAGFQRAPVRIEARKGGQQSRMDVDELRTTIDLVSESQRINQVSTRSNNHR